MLKGEKMSTIAAISTPNAAGGIAVIRISGENAIKIAADVVKTSSGVDVNTMKGYTCTHGYVMDGEELVDEVILTIFRMPKSYTGENVAEISCHGGIFITRKILRIVLDNGAVLAQPGEFTKRAFLNGKLSLNQAESVMDVIRASSDAELQYAAELRKGSGFEKINTIKNKIISVLGDLAAWADFPEEDIPEVNTENLTLNLMEICNELKNIMHTYDYGRIIREGVNTVICGRPNAGKSTLMNRLSGFERSIVTDIAGTTRDIIEETVIIGDIKLRLSDTAGIRETNDEVEKIGVDVAYKRVDEAELILAVFDNTIGLNDEDLKLIDKIKAKKCIALINKTDAKSEFNHDLVRKTFKNVIEISAKNNIGIDKLADCIKTMFYNCEIKPDDTIISNERQRNCAINSLNCIYNAINALKNGEMLDAITVILDEAAEYLMEITGEKVSDAVVDEVFSRFCVGK